MNIQIKYVGTLLLSVLLSASACQKDDQESYEFPDLDENSLVELPKEWVLAEAMMSGFPEGIEVYRNTTAYNGKSMNAYCLIFDPNAGLEFKPFLASATKKPSELYAEESGTTYACINGGFFGPGVSYSLVQHNNEVAAVNIKALTRTYNGESTTYYPTRGAFGLKADKTPEVTWMYHVGSGDGTSYSYPAPSPNELNTAPQPQPSASFPEGGSIWNVNSAIGGSPVLIKDGVVNVTDVEELIAVNNTTSRARSAIGYFADGKVVLLAVEGNNPEGGAGLNLTELAGLMKDMGCMAALNLDGGGSTYMMINGKETVRPSSSSGERAVMSVIFIKKTR